jgi:hypothetical protein
MEEELKYTDSDLQKSFWAGGREWIMRNSAYFFLFFGLGFCTGFLFCLTWLAKPVCGA